MLCRRLVLALCLLGCDGGTPADAGMDAGVDAGPRVRTHETLPPPEALVAGIAEARIPAPLGIGTMGFSPFGVESSVTPFAESFPGTVRAQGVLTFKAVALSRGPAHEVIFVRMDTIGVFQQLREAIVDEIMERTGRDVSDSLILAGNHTHSGPGRILMAEGALQALGDSFFPEFYDRIVDTLADVVEAALADQRPAELAYTVASSSEAHSDRRCENDPIAQPQEIPDMPLIAVRRGGQIDAIVASYGYHGTILGIDELTLSGDMGAAVEHKVEERFDHPVLVLFFNSWGADMAPGNPTVDTTVPAAAQPDGYERMHALGDVVADVILPELDTMVFSSDLEVRARTHRVRIDREVIGYDATTFPYPNGGVYCGAGEGDCTAITPQVDLDERCIAISRTAGLPKQTVLTAGQVGELYFVTAPGEWSTALSDGVLDRVRERTGGDAMMIGYANDYTGYSVGETDWYQGGYEASGALWGPLQGEYLAARLYETFETYVDLYNEAPYEEPVRVEPFSGYTYEPYQAEAPVALGTVTTDVPATVAQTDVVSFTINGTDPWLGLPTAALEQGDGTPVLRPNGEPVDSASYDFWLDFVPTPTYAEQLTATERTFAWTFHFPIARRTSTSIPALSGPYRFRVTIPTTSGDMTFTTGTFDVQ
jgi:hypothetical protein